MRDWLRSLDPSEMEDSMGGRLAGCIAILVMLWLLLALAHSLG